jgi:hypothetical protein
MSNGGDESLDILIRANCQPLSLSTGERAGACPPKCFRRRRMRASVQFRRLTTGDGGLGCPSTPPISLRGACRMRSQQTGDVRRLTIGDGGSCRAKARHSRWPCGHPQAATETHGKVRKRTERYGKVRKGTERYGNPIFRTPTTTLNPAKPRQFGLREAGSYSGIIEWLDGRHFFFD